MPRAKARDVAAQWLTRVGLEAKLDSCRRAGCSGGGAVGIARAVAMEPKVLL